MLFCNLVYKIFYFLLAQQSKSYFDRVVDSSSLAHLDDIQSTMVRRLSAVIACSGPPCEGVDIELEVGSLPIFSTIASEALEELVELSKTHEVLLACRTSGEVDRMKELTSKGQLLEGAERLHIEQVFIQTSNRGR